MATKKKSSGLKGLLGVGTGMAVALAAGAYYLYGTKSGGKARKSVRGWTVKMKGDVMDKLEKMESVTETQYHKVVEATAKKYAKLSNVKEGELKDLVSDLKRHWKNIKKELA